jgi:hypothetical protein
MLYMTEFLNSIGKEGIREGSPHKTLKLIPQNDLEWLAVNEPEWCDRKQFNFIRKGELFGAVYHVDNNHQFRWYSRNEWQNMRYYLGLDKKPHYRLVKGEWVKR